MNILPVLSASNSNQATAGGETAPDFAWPSQFLNNSQELVPVDANYVPSGSLYGPLKKKKAPTLHDSDWEPFKDRIFELHIVNKLCLKNVRDCMEAEYGFCANVRQYRSRISKWRLDKNVKPCEMKSIVRKRQKRKLVEVNKGDLIFRVRGHEVEPQNIVRWMKRHDVVESMTYAPSPAATTPSAVSCYTISEAGSPAPCRSHPALHLDMEILILSPRDHIFALEGSYDNVTRFAESFTPPPQVEQQVSLLSMLTDPGPTNKPRTQLWQNLGISMREHISSLLYDFLVKPLTTNSDQGYVFIRKHGNRKGLLMTAHRHLGVEESNRNQYDYLDRLWTLQLAVYFYEPEGIRTLPSAGQPAFIEGPANYSSL